MYALSRMFDQNIRLGVCLANLQLARIESNLLFRERIPSIRLIFEKLEMSRTRLWSSSFELVSVYGGIESLIFPHFIPGSRILHRNLRIGARPENRQLAMAAFSSLFIGNDPPVRFTSYYFSGGRTPSARFITLQREESFLYKLNRQLARTAPVSIFSEKNPFCTSH